MVHVAVEVIHVVVGGLCVCIDDPCDGRGNTCGGICDPCVGTGDRVMGRG